MDLQASVVARVLQYLLEQNAPVSLARLARQLQLAQSQVRRVLTELQQLQLLRLQQDGRRTLVLLQQQARVLLQAQSVERSADAGLARVRRQRWQRDASPLEAPDAQLDWVIEEAAVALLFNGHAHVVMMLTPQDLEDFALGHSLAEGIVHSVQELELIEIQQQGQGYAVHLAVPELRYQALLQGGGRSAAGSASCGLCGTRELEQALQLPPAHAQDGQDHDSNGSGVMELATLVDGFARMAQQQRLNARTGAAHAAALLLPDGDVLVREDIGRHSAVDKLLGAAARAGVQPRVLLLTSRLSFEIVRKAAQVGVRCIAAISAPSALALRSAARAGIEVWGFVRSGQGNRYETGSVVDPQQAHSRME